MDFKVLGPLRLIRPDGTDVHMVGASQRRLISVLALNAGSSVPAEWLADLLEISSGALRTSVSRLRRVVGFDVLVTSPPGYSLKSDRVDAIQFERTVATARAGRDPVVARAALEDALALWQGDAFAEFAHEEWAMAESRRLAELRGVAIRELIERLLAAGEWSIAIERARGLIDAEPFSDRPRGLLMRALAGEGRRADALRAFQEYRSLLLDEIGTEPGTDLVALDRSIATDQGIARGLAAPEPRRHNLPVPWSSFIGRDGDRATVVQLLRTHRLVTLTGSGGCGKTRLALHAAEEMVGALDGGTWWVELGPVLHGELVAERVALESGGTAMASAEPMTQLIEHLTSLGGVLLVLDNAEHVVDAVTELVHTVLSTCSEVVVLVTSREPLGLPGEVVWRVPSLTAPTDDLSSLVELETFDSVVLFIERATAARPSLVLDETCAPALAAICRRLDGVPLALELAAARVSSMPLGRVAAGLDDAFALLGEGPGPLRARHQTLHASIAWSVDLLCDSERTVLGRLAVFRSPFTAEAAEEVAADGCGIDAGSVVAAMAHLVDKSLLQLDDRTGGYRILEAVRQFCTHHLLTEDELEIVRGRHARYLARWCTEVGDGRHGIERGPIIREMPDVMAAIDWSRHNAPADALRMCSGLGGLRSTLGHYGNLVATWDWLMGFDRDGELSAEWAAAAAALMASATGAGLDVADVVGDVADRLPPENRRARGWLARGAAMVPGYRGDLVPIIDYAEGIVADRNDVEISIYGGFTAYLLSLVGRVAESERWLGEQRCMLRRHDAAFKVDTVGNGFAAAILNTMLRGQFDRVTLLASGPTPQDPGFSLTAAAAFAQVALLTGDRALLDWAVRWSRRGTIPLLRSLESLIEFSTRVFDGDVFGAADAASEFRERAAGVPIVQVHHRANLNVTLIEAGRLDEVAAAGEQVMALASAMEGGPLTEAVALLARAQLDLCRGRPDNAIEAARALLDVTVVNGLPLMAIDALDVIAVGSQQRGDCGVASRLLGASVAERDRLGYRRVMVAPRALYDDCLAAVHDPSEPLSIDTAVQRVRCLA